MTIAPPAPALSVVMSVYNDEAFLGPAIDSILRQSFTDFEFLIIDDHSTDASEAMIRARAAADRRIRVLPKGKKGRVPALNALIAEARAPWVAIMDSDDTCHPDRFAREMAFLAAHPDHGVVGCDCAIIDEHGQPLWRPKIERPLSHEEIVGNFESGPLMNHNAVIFSRELVRGVGGYRAAYRHAEDYDLWLRLSQVTKLANLPEKLVDYRVYGGQTSSRHVVEQARNAAIGWLAHRERLAGRPDPTDGLEKLPALGELDAMFGTGSAAYVRRRIIDRVIYAGEVLAGDGWEAFLGHIRDAGPSARLWRAAARLLRAGKPVHAARAALALATAG